MYTLPYTAAAFLITDLAELSESDRMDHFQHTFDGKYLFLLGSLTATTDQIDFRLYCHANFHEHCNVHVDSGDTESISNILFINAICCDPSKQGLGFATIIISNAMKILLKKIETNYHYVSLRTMNHAVIKLIKRALEQQDNDDNNKVIVYPIDGDVNNYIQKQDIIDIFNFLAKKYSWKNCVPNQLIIKNAYPSFLIPVFRGKEGKKHDSVLERVTTLIKREEGDALCCIVPLK